MSEPCPICDDSGFRTVERPDGNRVAIVCECRAQRRAKRAIEAARIPERYRHCTLDDYVPNYKGNNPSLNNALLQARNFVRNYFTDGNGKGILFTGPNGTGKTHLAVGMTRELIALGVQCMFVTYGELLKQVQNSYNPSVKETELEILRPVFEAEILVIDELGWTKPSDWVWDTVAHILNARYNDMKTTIITTNFVNERQFIENDLEKVAAESRNIWLAMYKETLGDRIGERMRSRLQEMCVVVEVMGEDFRKSQPGRATFSKRKYTAKEIFDLGHKDNLPKDSADETSTKKEVSEPSSEGSSKRLPTAPRKKALLNLPEMNRSLETKDVMWTQEMVDREVERLTAEAEFRKAAFKTDDF